ncbi:hypothetical protein GCM10011411_08850 [Aurantiacibacter arachoides]|nr:hypothetical protein GCM10011411_08850 [Aurantiacibacter arachoides]
MLLAAACSDAAENGAGAVQTVEQPASSPTTAAVEPAQSEPSARPAPGEPVEAAIYGRWDVTSARLTNPDGPVQAYGDDELRAIEAFELVIERGGIRWSGPALSGGGPAYSAFAAACDTPEPRPSGSDGGLSLMCADGTAFGPPPGNAQPALRLDGNDALTVRWFDGVTLELERAS